MKIYYNSKIAKLITFLSNYETIMLFGAVFTERDKEDFTTRAKYHELAHTIQYQTFFTLGLAIAVILMFILFLCGVQSWSMLWLLLLPVSLYYVWYFMEYIIRLSINLIRGGKLHESHIDAYSSISFEAEAFDLQYEYTKPCAERRTASSFSNFKYL